MKAVWKFPLALATQFSIQMPEGAEILSVQVQHPLICAWALCNVDAPKVARNIVCVGTGHEYPQRFFYGLKFIGTIQLQLGALVFHYFEDQS